MKVAFVLSGSPDGLKYLDKNREKVASKLKEYNWEVRVATFYSLALLQSYIDEFKNREIEDFIFFYTGHGDSSSSDGILTLKLHDKTPIDLNTLHNSYFSQLNPTRKAIILDACYSGNFEGRKFHDKTEYLCSSDFDEESYEDISEDGLELSYFSYYFCEALDNLEGLVTLERINEQFLKPNLDVQNSKYISIDSQMVLIDKKLVDIENSLPEFISAEPSKTNQIFLIFNQDNLSEISYTVTGYIQCEDEFDSETIEFKFENIYDAQEQESFIKLLVAEFDSDITIHFILPHTLFLVNFKLWEYRGTPLVNRYHILLHNKENYESKIRKYSNMISSWTTLYESIKTDKICNTLLATDNDERFDTRLNKMGIYFQHDINCHEKIINALDIAKIGLWQYKGGCIVEFGKWIDKESLGRLEEQSRNCNHMALVWDDMRLLKDLKEFKIRVNNG